MRRNSSLIWGIVAGVCALAFAGYTPKPRPYAIFAPSLSCEQAQQLAHRVVERLGYAATSPAPANESRASIIRGKREGVLGPETVTVTITCGADGVHVNAEADVPPCEQANRIVRRTVERLGYTVTSHTPAAYGQRGVIKGTRYEGREQDTVMLTITCDADAVYVDTRSDSPVVASTDFTAAITDFRRGFFALFNPLATAGQRAKSP